MSGGAVGASGRGPVRPDGDGAAVRGRVRPGGAGGAGNLSLPPLGPAPPVSVVVPVRGEPDALRAAVASALAQDVPGTLEVVVAAAPGEARRVARQLAAADSRVTAVDNPAGTTPAGLNVAVAASTGQVVARLDAHAVLPPGYLARAVDTLRATGAANVGGRQVPQADQGFARAVAAAMRSPVGSGGARYRSHGPSGDVDTVYLGVFRREALEAVGGFDERLLRNQDYELNHRLRAAGGRVYLDADLAVRYRPRGSPAALWRQYLEYGRFKRVVARMHPGSVRARQLAPPALVAALVGGGVLAVAGWPVALGVVAGGELGVVAAAAGVAADRLRDAPPVAGALLLMHVAWGVGFLGGAGGWRGTAAAWKWG